LLARACYHLGNRHVPLQIESRRLRYLHDHVLDAMVLGLGLSVVVEDAPFDPEPGAYGGQVPAHPHGQARHPG
jgi:urease accessory protein